MKDKKILIAVGKEEFSREDVIGALRCRKTVEEVLTKLGVWVDTLYLKKNDFEDIEKIKAKILYYDPFCVFNIFEGFNDNSEKEAEFVELLEGINIPFTGNSSDALRICLNKRQTKKILRENNIPTPEGIFIKTSQNLDINSFRFPLFIKPCFEDASLGVDVYSLVTKKEDLYAVLKKKIKEFPKGLIVEEFISGKEYSVGLLGDYPYRLIGISILDYSKYKECHPFLTYSSKWATASMEFDTLWPSVEEKLNGILKQKVIDIAEKVGKILRCDGYFRVDLREKEGELFVLDVNPNPDINKDSGFIKQSYHKGYTYEDIIEKILAVAIKSHNKNPYVLCKV